MEKKLVLKEIIWSNIIQDSSKADVQTARSGMPGHEEKNYIGIGTGNAIVMVQLNRDRERKKI